jgi:hypothetical protein
MVFNSDLNTAIAMSLDMNVNVNVNVEEPSDQPQEQQEQQEQPQQEQQRRLALQAIKRDAATSWSNKFDYRFQNDKEFVLAALNHSPTLPPKSDFERKFPQSLRFDRDVVLAFLSRDDFELMYRERQFFVPGCLCGDKEVMLAYCSKVPRSLQECSEALVDDADIVTAALQLGGLELQYASTRLQQDVQILTLACQKDGRALEFCPLGPTRDALLNNKPFLLKVLTQNGGSMLKLADQSLRRDPELVLQALAHGLHVRDAPCELLQNVPFLKQALSSKSTLYLELTPILQHDIQLALCAVVADDSSPPVHSKALACCPTLSQTRAAVLAFCQRGDKEFLETLLLENAFRDDKDIMMLAIRRDCRLLASASQRLQQDPEVIFLSITETSAWTTLKTVPWTVQRAHPEITIQSIKLLSYRNIRYLPSHLPEEFWSNRDIVIAWLERGGRVLDAFERTLARDTELALTLAKFNWSEFHKVGETLLHNRTFMLQAVQRDGRVLRFASTEIRQDFKVVVQAVANHKGTLAYCTGGIHPATFHVMVQEKMKLQQTFLNDFLRGITICPPQVQVPIHNIELPPPPAIRQVPSHLPKLDLGDETSQAFKQLIAEYLGVPVGMELTLLRKCWSNLNSTTPTSAAASTSTAPTSISIRERLAARELRDHHHPRLDWLAHGPHPPPNNNAQQQQHQADGAHPHPAWNNMQRLAHYRNRRMQRLHIMGGRGRVNVFLHGNGNPNNNNNPIINRGIGGLANPFDAIVDLNHPQPPDQLWNFLEDEELDNRHLAQNLDDDIDDDDDDLEMEFML